jgi:hypothetical protein
MPPGFLKTWRSSLLAFFYVVLMVLYQSFDEMNRNKQLRRQIASLRDRRDEHLKKIADESGKERPRWEVIDHWIKEVQNFDHQIDEKDQELQKSRRG